MGNVCECLVHHPLFQSIPMMQTLKEDKLHNERLEFLRKGQNFKRKKYTFGFGTGSESIRMFMGDEEDGLIWRVVDSAKQTNISFKEIKEIKPVGDDGFQFLSGTGDILLDILCDSNEIREKWIDVLHLEMEYIRNSSDTSSKNSEPDDNSEKSQSLRKMMEESAAKQKYWIQRQSDLKTRQAEAAEKKKKLAVGGMKYTAIAMANRANSGSSPDDTV